MSLQNGFQAIQVQCLLLQEGLNSRQVLEPTQFQGDCNDVFGTQTSHFERRLAAGGQVQLDGLFQSFLVERGPHGQKLDRPTLDLETEIRALGVSHVGECPFDWPKEKQAGCSPLESID